MIQFTELQWNRDISRGTTSPNQPLSLGGTWTEVRTDNRGAKTITVSGNSYVEVGSDGLFAGTITLVKDRVTIKGNDGSVEELVAQPGAGKRMNFADGQTGQTITRFHWVRM